MRSFSHKRSQSHTTTLSNSHSPSSSVISLSTLSLTSPNIFNTININRSPSANNNSNGNAKTHINGLDSHSYSQLIKKLDQALSKFNNLKKVNSTSKTNVLRLVLLPYLRYPLNYISGSYEPFSLIELDLDLIILESNILLSWWSTLLHILTNDYSSIPSLDKNCYFESISRLISYNLWFLLQENQVNNNSNIGSQTKSLKEISIRFNHLLLQTFEFSVSKLNSKNINLSLNAFIGKIFANCFFKLPDISRGLSFLLNTKVKNFKLIYNISILNSLSSTIDFSSSDVLFNGFPNVLNEVADALPNHLTPLISSTIKPRNFNFIIEKNFMNSINPPMEKINGIKETKGIWVNRWSSLENIDLFISFFRHYLSISSIYLKALPKVLFNNYYVYGLPGFLCFITHIYEILNFQILNRIKIQAIKNNNNSNNGGNSNNNSNNNNNNNNNINVSFTNPLLIVPPAIPIELPSDKILKVLRDFLINPLNDYEMFLKNGVIKSFENVLKLLISKTKIFENLNIELIFEIFINFIKSVKTFNEMDSIDWMFWIDVMIKLLNSKNINCELKSICIFYELWDYIPINLYLDNDNFIKYDSSNFNNWFSDSKKSLKFNLTTFLLNEDNWLQFFGHYMPLVRNLYIKLLIWKILGVDSIGIKVEDSSLDNNDKVENEIENQFNFKNLANEKAILDLVDSKLNKTFKLTKDIKFKPVDPVLNKKFSILKIYPDDDKKKEKRLRGYPFEILDDAIYSTMGNNLTNSNTAVSSPAPTLTLTPPSSSNQLSPSTTSNSKTSNKFSSSWVGKIFHKKSEDIESNKTNSKWSKFGSNNISNNLLATTNHSNTSNENIGTSPPSPLFSKTPSSMTSLSSLQSSLSSSNDLPEKPLNSNSNINLNNLNFNASQPPELLNKSIELQNGNYEFQLVNNDLKILNFIQKLNTLNHEENKFYKSNDILIYNFQPMLPALKYFRSKKNIRLDSLNSDIDSDGEFHSEIHSGVDIGINDGEDDEIGDDVDLTGGFGEVEGIDFEIRHELKNTNKHEMNEKKLKLSGVTSTMMNFCNSIKEYNSSVIEFEKFIELRLKEFDPDELNLLSPQSTTIWTENNLLDTDESNSVLDINFIPNHHSRHSHKIKPQLKLSKENFKKLSLQIPNIIPELPGDKLNGY